MSDRIRMAVIGAGGFFDKRAAQHLIEAENVTLHAVMVRDQARADALAEKHGAARGYSTADDVFGDADVDAVYLVTPVCTHMPLTLAAAEAGKHVLCEKPMALNASECRRMIDACAEADVKLAPAFMSRFHTPFLRLKDCIDDGLLGDIVACRSRWGGHYPPAPGAWRQAPELGGGGPLMDTGSHAFDLLRFWLGEIVEVAALSDTLAFDYAVEDTCTVLAKFASGAQGVVESHWSAPRATNTNEVLGSKGVAITPHVTVAEPIQICTRDGNQTIPPDGRNRYTAMFEHFAEACLTGRPPAVTGEDGARNVEILAAAYQSARERRFVPVS